MQITYGSYKVLAKIMLLRARLVDYLFPMSKVLKIRVGRSGKKKKRKKKKKRQKYL